jgi:hypothetical protein
VIEQAVAQLLRRTTAVGLQVFLVRFSVSQVMELGAKVGQVLTVGDGLFFLPIHLAQSLAIVEGDLDLVRSSVRSRHTRRRDRLH